MTINLDHFGNPGTRHTHPPTARREGQHLSQQQAAVDVILAKVGHELARSLDTGDALTSICRLTVGALPCDYSCILLWKPREGAFVAVARHGIPDERWDMLRHLRLSRAVMGEFIARCERDSSLQLRAALVASTPDAPLTLKYGTSASIHTVLRRGAETIGLLVAGYRHRPESFVVRDTLIARGIAQLGAIALDAAAQVHALRHADALKSELVATVAHELRTPLSSILGYNDLLLEQAYGRLTPQQYATLRHVDRSARQLLDLINTILDLSRLEHGRLALDLRATNLGELLDEIGAEIRPLFEQAGLTFACHVPPALAPLRTDPRHLKMLLRNLLMNALKFTARGGVSVAVGSRGGGIEIAVADTGAGMSPTMVQQIFQPFRQAGPAQRPGYGGAGLGLFIVRRILEMLGGTVGIDTRPGGGSTFRVWLPHMPPSPTEEPRADATSPNQEAPHRCAATIATAFSDWRPIADAAALD